ncbi:type VI secretion system tube protein Hcp [Burkholderia semiarida]|uniref:Type VI secretion system tube protein Hcp n=1 Tax=Burkholderia semiarida TaxID=2843303 RepID=A0ABW7L5S1_9BURK|nr:type VI secretion system tube protein Hcp [Burkholderia arboris]
MAQDIFLKLAGIRGESRDPSHPDEIEVLAWDGYVVQNTDGGGGGTIMAGYDLKTGKAT